ncbi:type VI secretion system baseplate subunit TssE [Aromatoleum sp.]|uniref:type VI secretion system baseplate subunit TssE n=1 Tax=Aromatoleum sp. TaxID=2307007 RepID=UPI002FCC0373
MKADHWPDRALPSLLDRLLDDAPGAPFDATPSPFGAAAPKAALARDLEALLNTRVSALSGIDALPLAARSILTFGIPDFSGLSLLSADDCETVRERVRRTIAAHEPRLTEVRVTLDALPGAERKLRFRVDAVLRKPYDAPVRFDAVLDLASSAYRVRE